MSKAVVHILGIDPGTQCGWAVRDTLGLILACGTLKLKGKDGERYGLRALRFKVSIENILSEHGITHIAYELVRRHVGTDAAHVYGGLQMLLELIACTWDLPCMPIPVQAIKQLATGKGNAQKAEMVAAACRKWPSIRIVDDNLPDALWIAEAGYLRLTGALPEGPKKKRKTKEIVE